MTNKIALALAILVITLLILDRVLFQSAALFFLARKFIDLVDWLEFWR